MLGDMGFPGGKGRLYARIIGLMPSHRGYFEPFAGGAAVARFKSPAHTTILIDRDPAVVAALRTWAPSTWQVLCRDAVSFLDEHPFDREDLIYCDPPYVASTRRTKRRIYRYEFTD